MTNVEWLFSSKLEARSSKVEARRSKEESVFPSTFHLSPSTCICVLFAVCCLLCAGSEAAILDGSTEPVPVITLSGNPYELGRQQGEILREQVRASVATILGYFRRYLKIPFVRSYLANAWLGRTWQAAEPFIPSDYLEELRGLADGSGVSLRDLQLLHAIPDRTYACSNFAAWGRVTNNARLIHVRNLDWNIDVGIQRFATIFVVRPEGKHAFVNVGWAGFIGVLSGINEAQLSIGQVGAETVDATFKGDPMVFLMRRVLEEAGNLEEASQIIERARRTVGVNYCIADAKVPSAVVIETTARYERVFEADDPLEHQIVYARPLVDCVFRADAAIDPLIRERQMASKGNPRRPGLEDPSGSSAYDIRYLGQAAGLLAYFGRLDSQEAQKIARSIAPSSNVQSVIMAWPDLWVANAVGKAPAAHQAYGHFDLNALLGDKTGLSRQNDPSTPQ